MASDPPTMHITARTIVLNPVSIALHINYIPSGIRETIWDKLAEVLDQQQIIETIVFYFWIQRFFWQ